MRLARLRTLELSIQIHGRPKWWANFVLLGFCRVRWVAAALLVLIPLDLAAGFLADPPLKDAFISPFVTTWIAAHATLLVAALLLLVVVPRDISVRSATSHLILFALASLLACAAIQGGAAFNPIVAGFSWGYGCLLAIVPLRLWQLVTIMLLAFAFSVGFGSWFGLLHVLSESPMRAWWLNPSLVMGCLGICINLWFQRNHRESWLQRLLLRRSSMATERERRQNKSLLDSALTAPVAEELRRFGQFDARLRELCVTSFDVVRFTDHCRRMPVSVVMQELSRIFILFDRCCEKYGVEPLRTQGDGRIALAGLWEHDWASGRPILSSMLAALQFQREICALTSDGLHRFHLRVRIGIHVGPVMMSVVTGRRLCFDVLGETVNIAARLEQGAEANQIMVSEQTLWGSRGRFDHGELRNLEVKGIQVNAAPLLRVQQAFLDNDGEPNEHFWSSYLESPLHDPSRINGFVDTSA